MSQFLTVPEVADLLRVTPMTVRRWIKSGRLPASQIGRDYRIQSADLEALVAGAETGTGAS